MNRSPEELFAAASALAPGARKQFLDEYCTDPAIRAQVERLLASAPTKSLLIATALDPGSTLGHYTIQRSLGAGGMGAVYEAIDQKLHRTVAIKILAPGAVEEEDRLRFLREAQAVSALNHPNIVTVYETGSESGTDYIVMERITGETMRQAIGKKGLPARTVIAYAIQMADALAAAHEAGIVHRDLKPGNVMITGRGQVKLLDFGLAKMNKASSDLSQEMTLTRAGHTVGTVYYMSPEQAQGKFIDGRSDIFSFGAVLYEMLTGTRAFYGDSEIATLAAILEREPEPIEHFAPRVEPPLQRVISNCLKKKLHDRWQHMIDVKLVLEEVLKELDSPPAPVKQDRSPRWLFPVAGVIAGAILTAAAFRVFRAPAPAVAPEPVYRMLTATGGLNDYPALSKDGRFLAFASDRGGGDNLDIWLQQIGAQDAIRLTTDVADESEPAFSPDGTRIAFRSEKNGGGIYVVPTLGGDSMLLASGGHNPRFSPDGRWIAYWSGRGEGSVSPGSSGVFIVEAGGGQPRAIHPEMGFAFYPSWSPKGDRLLVRGWKSSTNEYDFWILPIDGGDAKRTEALAKLSLEGLGAVRQGLDAAEWIDGRALFTAPLADSANMWEMDLTADGIFSGPARRVTRGPGRQVHPAWAATAELQRIAFSDQVLNSDVWTMSVDPQRGSPRSEMSRITSAISQEWAPSMTSDGREVLYITTGAGGWSLLLKQVDGGRARKLLSSPTLIASAQISGDGRRVVYSNAHWDLMVLPSAGGAVSKVCDHCGSVTGVSRDGNSILYEPVKDEDLLVFDVADHRTSKLALRPKSDSLLSGARFSSDEKWVAFHSIEGPEKITRVWIAPVNRTQPAPASSWIALTDGTYFAENPCWSPDGNTLYFISERDGFRCFWGQPLDPKTKKPRGDPFALRHFHSARQSLRGLALPGVQAGLSAGEGRLVFSFAELTGNIWIEEQARAK